MIEPQLLMSTDMEAKDTREIGNTLGDQLDTKVFTDPDAYLEALDVIISCGSLLKVTSNMTSLINLLNKARTLLVENAVNLLLKTVRYTWSGHAASATRRSRGGSETEEGEMGELPLFWMQTYCAEEADLWLRIFDVILYCWTQGYTVSPTVEEYIVKVTKQIKALRRELHFEETELSDGFDTVHQQCISALQSIQVQCKPSIFYVMANLKRPPKGQTFPLLVKIMTGTLQLAGAMPIISHNPSRVAINSNSAGSVSPRILTKNKTTSKPQPAKPNIRHSAFDNVKKSISQLTLFHFAELYDIDKLSDNVQMMEHIKKNYLNDDHLTAQKVRELRLRDLKGSEWHDLKTVCSSVVEYMHCLDKLYRFKRRLFIKNNMESFKESIVSSVKFIIVRQLNHIEHFVSFARIPNELASQLKSHRDEIVSSINNEYQESSQQDSLPNGVLHVPNNTYDLLLSNVPIVKLNLVTSRTLKWQTPVTTISI